LQLTLSEQNLTQALAVDVGPARARYKPPLTLKRY
jgi:hypothetical protein